MSDRSKQSRTQAEAAFRKTQKAERDKDKSEAMQQYESERDATLLKKERLKELRLAKEAADAKEAAKEAAASKKKKTKKTPAKKK
jgi:hypothetical protein